MRAMRARDGASGRLVLAELKARCGDLAAVRARLHARAAYVATVRQLDTYFSMPHGRLKLREVAGHPAHLIYYERPDLPAATLSAVELQRVEDGPVVRAVLAAAFGVQARVAKTREIWRWEAVQIHLDTVEGLGTFVELEEIAGGPDASEQALRRVRRMIADLGLREEDVVDRSYGDLAVEVEGSDACRGFTRPVPPRSPRKDGRTLDETTEARPESRCSRGSAPARRGAEHLPAVIGLGEAAIGWAREPLAAL